MTQIILRDDSDDDDGDDLAHGIRTGAILSAPLWLMLAGLALSSCTSNPTPPGSLLTGLNSKTQTGVDAAVIALTEADRVALAYTTMPQCGPTHAKPLCSEAPAIVQIKNYGQKAHDAVVQARKSGNDATLATANAAISAFSTSIPPVPSSAR